jgi:hypothetical protein
MSKLIFSIAIGLMFSTSTFAEKLPGNVAIHIAKRHYEHPVRLLHPYLDVWHMKGPPAEKVALKAFTKRFANSNTCDNSSQADVVVLLEPQMFYNAQLRVFHAEIIAKVFTHGAEPPSPDNAITTIKKQAQQSGDLGIKPEFYMAKAYAKAMDKVMRKLETDKAFLATLNKAGQSRAETLCVELDNLPVSKIYY